MNDRVAGIIGGMGPEATVELMSRVVKATRVEREEDHLRLLVDSNPKVPSRMKALIDGSGESAGAALARTARFLEAAGSHFLAMPCISAHYYREEVASAVTVPLLDMVDLSIEAVLQADADVTTIGLIASTAVLKTGLYETCLAKKGLERHIRLCTPSPGTQELVLAAIKRIKVGDCGPDVVAMIQAAADELVDKGAHSLIVACTDVSLVAGALRATVGVVDALQVLAECMVREASVSSR